MCFEGELWISTGLQPGSEHVFRQKTHVTCEVSQKTGQINVTKKKCHRCQHLDLVFKLHVDFPSATLISSRLGLFYFLFLEKCVYDLELNSHMRENKAWTDRQDSLVFERTVMLPRKPAQIISIIRQSCGQSEELRCDSTFWFCCWG